MSSGPINKVVIRTFLFIILTVGGYSVSFSQSGSQPVNQSGSQPGQSKSDSIKNISAAKDSVLKKDSVPKQGKEEDPLKSKVHYLSRDSSHFDVANQKVYLYGEAEVVYEDLNLKAGYIELDMKNNIVFATGRKDSAGKEVELPVFTQSKQVFNSHKMAYNFKTKKGKINEVITKEADGYIHGEIVKKDSTNIIYVSEGQYTTCDLEHPHFYIRAKKLKVIQNDKIVTGPAYLVIMDIPTILALPFGFFPNKKGRKSGILIPTYGNSPTQGFFLTNGGFYWGISDYLDASFMGDIYTVGSWAARTHVNYAKKYKYTGNFDIKFAQFISGDPIVPGTTSQNNFLVDWTHREDSKADPGTSFSASVNAGSSSYNKLNSYTPSTYLNNNLSSNINYTKAFGTNNMFNLIVAATHSQNNLSNEIDISLPQVDFSMNRIYPFKDNTRSTPMWYDKIGLSYSAEVMNSVTTYDSVFLKPAMFKAIKNGLHQNIPISESINIFKYFIFTPSANFNSNSYYQTISKHYDPLTRQIVTDTIQNQGAMENDYSFSTNLSTKIYGNYQFRKAYIKQIRHLITPTVGFTYIPDFSKANWGYYGNVKDSNGVKQTYSRFQNSLYGPGPAPGLANLITWSINNTLEAKVYDAKDTVHHERKISIIDMFTIASSYNSAADSFKMNPISITGRTKLFKHLDVNYNGTLDPYKFDAALDRRIDELDFDNKNFGRLTNYSVALSSSLGSTTNAAAPGPNSGNTPNQIPPAKPKDNPNASALQNMTPFDYANFTIPWKLTFNYNFVFSKPGLDAAKPTQSITFSGDVSMTKKWKISYTSGFDLTARQLTFTQFNIYRDLHCWEMKITWVPFGPRQSYMLTINVKSAVLQDLKLTRKRDWYDYQ